MCKDKMYIKTKYKGSSFGCQGTLIKCPNSVGSSCEIYCNEDNSCSSTSIEVPYTFNVDTMTIECGKCGCQFATILFGFYSVNN